MSTIKKTGMVLILLIGVAVVIHAFSADRTPEEFRLRELTPAEHSDAERFIGELSGYARRGAAAKFAQHCENPRARKTANSWRAMRKFSSSESRLTGIHSYEAEPERYRLHLENTRGEIGTAICHREDNGKWKFISFTFVTPEEVE